MLCPEVCNFPPPKIMVTHKENMDFMSVKDFLLRNYYFKSLIVTCPDEIKTPSFIQDVVTEDTDYYKLTNCSLTEFVEPTFIECFVKTGKIHCLSVGRNCVIENCVAITPDGHLVLHVLDYTFQTLGLEGTKRPYNYYEVKIDLKTITHYSKVRSGLDKLKLFDLNITWEPNNEDICPSSIAKYFSDRNVNISVHSLKSRSVSPFVNEIPVLKDVDIEEMVEWVGLLAHDVDITPTEQYISMYSQPDSDYALKTGRISILIVKGFITPTVVSQVCEKVAEYVGTREMDNYWASVSVQSDENSLWKWKTGSTRMFQAQDSCCSAFFTNNGHVVYSVGELKYS
ncbi:uncharacterized protein LOC113505809 [Trichoplusia ni]|uniref:Uncharacterized protein LOC113505809 n=1 Tax=Trichoplusia ni TaxID=7111 RepID=A0A7E5WVX4_TRINI|nr:uncharacterized protein LOC113505809 [Trichoplusia ni]